MVVAVFAVCLLPLFDNYQQYMYDVGTVRVKWNVSFALHDIQTNTTLSLIHNMHSANIVLVHYSSF